MILGVQIINFDIFDNDQAGILIDESVSPAGEGGRRANPMRKLNALIGRNNTGKTSFMGCLAYMKDCVTDGVTAASISCGRPGFSNMTPDKSKPSKFKVFFKLGDRETGKSDYIQYELSILANRFGTPVVSYEKAVRSTREEDGTYKLTTLLEVTDGEGFVLCPGRDDGKTEEISLDDDHRTALSLFGKLRRYTHLCDLFHEISGWFFCSFSSEEQSSYFTEGGAPGGHKHLNSTGSNVGNVLEFIKQSDEEEYNRIVSEIQSKIPTMKKKKNLPKALSESPDKLFLYLLLLRDGSPRSTIFIETPDKDLYHDMVDVLADEMREYSIRNHYCQIVFSTHNPYIIETMSPKEIWVFSRSFEIDSGDVTISCAGDDPLVNEMFSQGVGMGAIWYGGYLDPDQKEE